MLTLAKYKIKYHKNYVGLQYPESNSGLLCILYIQLSLVLLDLERIELIFLFLNILCKSDFRYIYIYIC